MNRIAMGAWALVFVAGVLPASLPAQELAVRGKTPGNPVLIVSVPDAAKLWGKYARSPFGREVEKARKEHAALPENSTTASEIARVEQQLGLSLDPAELFSSTITGFDFYIAEVEGSATSVSAAVAFTDAKWPQLILDQIKRDAASARGTAGGYGADQVQDLVADGARKLYLQAFNIYLAAEGNVLLYSADQGVLESALKNAGQAAIDSDYFKTFMAGLPEGEPRDAWLFGEVSLLQNLSPTMASMPVAKTDKVAAGSLQFELDHVKIATYVPVNHMDPLLRRYALTAPPPGDVAMLQYFKKDPILAYASNHFDALAFIEGLVESTQQVPGMEVFGVQVDTALEQSQDSLGFDLKNDLLANMGPEFGFVLGDLVMAEAQAPEVEMALLFGVKDAERFGVVLQALEQSIGAPVKKEEYNGQTINSPEGGMPGAWTLTAENVFVLAASVDDLKATLDIAKGGADALVMSEAYRESAKFLKPERNEYLTMSLQRIMGIVKGYVPQMEENAEAADKALAIFGTIGSVTAVTSYPRDGKRQEIVVQMNP